MLNLYEPNVKATIAFLRLLKVRVNNETVNERLQNHPDWPSLLCISDSLNEWHVPNGAGKIQVSEIDQLPVPFIACTIESESPLSVVIKISDTEVTHYSGTYAKPLVASRNDFLRKWDGVYLIAEPNKDSGDQDYNKHRRKFLANSLIPGALAISLIIFSLFLFQRAVNTYPTVSGKIISGLYFQYLIQLTGVIVTSLLLWYEIDRNNPLLKKVCSGIARGNCSAILTSRHAKIFDWLSWTEIGCFYFSGGLLFVLFAERNLLNAMSTVAWLNLVAMPYTVFSLYYQARVAKRWCVLCLVVQALLILGTANVLINFSFPEIFFLPHNFVANSLLVYVLPPLIWFSIKPFVISWQQAKNIRREYRRVKFNSEIFDTLLKKQKSIDNYVDLGITLGNRRATNTITKVCNPFCAPCAKAHPKIEELLATVSDLKVRIIFTATNDKEDLRSIPVRHFLAIAEKNNESIQDALNDWYLATTKDYRNFAKKYPISADLSLQNEKIEAMNKWCGETGIQFTPTFFFNGRQLPNGYDIEDLKYFLLE